MLNYKQFNVDMMFEKLTIAKSSKKVAVGIIGKEIFDLFALQISKHEKGIKSFSDEFENSYQGDQVLLAVTGGLNAKGSIQLKLIFDNVADRLQAREDYNKFITSQLQRMGMSRSDFKIEKLKLGGMKCEFLNLPGRDKSKPYTINVAFKPDTTAPTSINEFVATARGESYAGLCVTAYSQNNNTNFSDDDLLKAYNIGSYKVPFKEILINSSIWLNAGKLSAKSICKEFGGGVVKSCHASDIMLAIDKKWTKMKKAEGKTWPFGDINKWSPADIYCHQTSSNEIISLVNACESLGALNNLMLELYKSKKVIGVSLKQVNKPAKISLHNDGTPVKDFDTFSNIRLSYGKNGPLGAMDVFIFCDMGADSLQMQFRNNGGQFQGEITSTKNKLTRHGKISTGPLNIILSKSGLKNVPTMNDAINLYESNPDKFWQEFYDLMFKSGEVKSRNVVEFQQEVEQSKLYLKGDKPWHPDKLKFRYAGKYLGALLLSVIDAPQVQEIFVKQTMIYALSVSTESSVYIKTN